MKPVPTGNMAAYLRRIAIDGYIIQADHTDIKAMTFEYTLSQALQKGNNLAFHLIQSFEPGEVDYQKAHEIGKQLADAVTKGQHEYVLTTHIDKGHVHNHIICAPIPGRSESAITSGQRVVSC